MAVSRKLISSLRRELKTRADPEYGKRMQAYAKSAMPLYGIKAADMRRLAQTAFKAIPLKDFQDWQDTILALWRGARYREELACAIFMCEAPRYKSFQTMDTLPMYDEMITTGAWWDLVDPIATHCIRHLLLQYPGEMSRVLIKWSRCENIWKRRAAILSQIRLKQKTNVELLYKCIGPSLDSDEFFLQKAIGWALRDYAAHDFPAIKHYVDSHEDSLSKLSRREALKNRD